MKNTAYSEKLKDPRWQKKRLEILERDSFTCVKCSDKENTLHVHHRYYVPKRELWNYPDWACITLCKTCHDNEHAIGQKERYDWEVLVEFSTDSTDLDITKKSGECFNRALEAHITTP